MGVNDTQVHPLSELPDFSELEKEEAGMPPNWCFCQGDFHHPHLEHQQWAIKIVDEDLTAHLYPLPMPVSVLVKWSENSARRDIQRDIRNALGL